MYETYNPIGGLVLFAMIGLLTWFFYTITRESRAVSRWEEKYYFLKELLLEKISKNKGIDLEKEGMRRLIVNRRKSRLRKRIEEQMYTEMFPEDVKKSK